MQKRCISSCELATRSGRHPDPPTYLLISDHGARWQNDFSRLTGIIPRVQEKIRMGE